MAKKLILTLGVFLLVGGMVFFVALATDRSVALPQVITVETPCPVVGCTQNDAGCHASAPAPGPDGTFIMSCPFATCSSSDCHAWDRVVPASKPSDASLNLWIVSPVVLVLILVVIIKKVR